MATPFTSAGDVVVVYGAGPIGLGTAYAAFLRGAARVYVVDHVPSRLATAESIDAISIDLTQGELPSEQILRLEPGGVPRVCDAVGYECVNTELQPDKSFILNDAIRVLSPGGGIALTGAYVGQEPNPGQPLLTPDRDDLVLTAQDWWLKNITLRGSLVLPGPEADRVLPLVQSGRARPGFVFERGVSIDEAPEAYRSFNKMKVQKVAIKF